MCRQRYLRDHLLYRHRVHPERNCSAQSASRLPGAVQTTRRPPVHAALSDSSITRCLGSGTTTTRHAVTNSNSWLGFGTHAAVLATAKRTVHQSSIKMSRYAMSTEQDGSVSCHYKSQLHSVVQDAGDHAPNESLGGTKQFTGSFLLQQNAMTMPLLTRLPSICASFRTAPRWWLHGYALLLTRHPH